MWTLHDGDCLDWLPTLPREGAHALICDPPYHLTSIVDRMGSASAAPIPAGKDGAFARLSKGFMGQQWDGGDVAFRAETWRAAYDALRPGAYLAAFGGTRTVHRLACAIEDAGFEIRDQLQWLYGSGWPKGEALHGAAEGYRGALKPACEPIVLARKPLSEGSVLANIRRWGCGALAVDACRIPVGEGEVNPSVARRAAAAPHLSTRTKAEAEAEGRMENRSSAERYRMERAAEADGRYPANVLHDGSAEVLEAFEAFGERGAWAPVTGEEPSAAVAHGAATFGARERVPGAYHGDTGTAARFFYCAKASPAEKRAGMSGRNPHPTVKPIALTRWLARLLLPPPGAGEGPSTILVPFAGSGSEMIGALRAGWANVRGCELTPEYAVVARERLAHEAREPGGSDKARPRRAAPRRVLPAAAPIPAPVPAQMALFA